MRFRDHRIFTPLRGQGTKALALKGSFWTTAGFGTQKVLQFGSNLILTRLLFPEAFGTMALVSVFIVALAMFSDLGIKPAIIQNERGDTDFLNTAWTIQVIRGFAIWIVATLLAWPLAQLYGQPILFPLLSFVSVSAAIQGFQSTALATRNRKLQLGLLTLIPLMAQIFSVILTITLAWIFRSVWALAVGSVAGGVVTTILSHLILSSHRHKFHIERRAFDTLLNFGKWIFLSTIVGYFAEQGLRAIQGLFVTPADLGIIYIAAMLAWAPVELTRKLATLVGFPVLSQVVREEPERLRFFLSKIRLRLFAFGLPILLILALFSGWIIDTLYDERYAAAGRYLAILSLDGAIVLLTMGFSNALLAIGDSKKHFVYVGVHTALRTVGLLLGFQIGNIEGMLLGLSAGALLSYSFLTYLSIKLRWFTPLLDIGCLVIIFVTALFVYVWNFMPA